MNKCKLIPVAIGVSLTLDVHAISVLAIPSSVTEQTTEATEATEAAETTETDERVSEGFRATPKLSTGDDILLIPSIEASYQDVWRHWWGGDEQGSETYVWKHKFASSIELNGEIDGNSNEELIQSYMIQGGNVDFNLLLGISFWGSDHEGLSIYTKAQYSYLDTKQFISPNETEDLEIETAQIGIGIGVKFKDDFYLNWEGMKAHVLGDEDPEGAFFDSVDQRWLQQVSVSMRLKEALGDDGYSYIQLFRAWGAGAVDGEFGISFSKSFNVSF